MFDTSNTRPPTELDGAVPYCFLLEWEWPEHIELLLRRLIWTQLNACDGSNGSAAHQSDVDSLSTKLGWLIAVNPDTSPAILDVLAMCDAKVLAERVAEHAKASPDTLRRLATHRSAEVRAAVAENSATPEDVLKALANDESLDVRYLLAENPATPREILNNLTEDDNCYVAHRAIQTINRLEPAEPAAMPFRGRQSTTASGRRLSFA